MTNEQAAKLKLGDHLICKSDFNYRDYFLSLGTEYKVVIIDNTTPVIMNDLDELLYIHRRYYELFEVV